MKCSIPFISSALALALSVGWVLAQQPATRPAVEGVRPGMRDRMSPDEQREALAFAEKHMQVLHQMIEEAPKNSVRHYRLMRFAVERHRWLQRIEREDPEMYDEMLQRLKSQDEVFELVKRFKLADEDRRSDIREQLRGKVQEIVGHWLDERQRRIDGLRRMLEREERQLEKDRQNIDELTTQRMEWMLNEMDDLRPRDFPGGPTTGPATMPGDWEGGRPPFRERERGGPDRGPDRGPERGPRGGIR